MFVDVFIQWLKNFKTRFTIACDMMRDDQRAFGVAIGATWAIPNNHAVGNGHCSFSGKASLKRAYLGEMLVDP
jgi:hypothetical protein